MGGRSRFNLYAQGALVILPAWGPEPPAGYQPLVYGMLVVISEPTLPAIPLLRISLEAFRPSPVVRLQTGLAGKNACLQTRPGDYIPLDSSDNFDRTEMLEDNDFVLAGKFWVLRIVNFDTLTFHDTLIPPRGPGIPADETPSYCLDCLLSLSEAIADEKEPAACATDLLTSNSLGQGGSWAPDCRAAVGAAGRSSDCGLYAWRQAPVNSIELSPPGQADNKQRIHVAPPFRCPSGADGADCSTGDKSHGAYTVVSDGRVLCCSSEVLPGRATRWLSANSSSFPESGVTLAGGPTLTPSPARISNGEQRMRWRKKSRKKSCLGAASGTLSCTKTNTVCPESPNSPRLSSQEPSGSATLPACRSADSTETGICARTPAGARSSFSAAPRSHASEANRVAGLEHQCGCPDGSSDHCSRTDCKNQAPSFRGRVITFYVAKTDYSNSQEHSSFLAATTHRLGLLRDQLQHDLEQTTTGPQIYSSHGEAVQVPRREADISTLLSSPGDCSEQERPQLEQSSLVQRRIRTLAFRWLAKTYEELLDAFFLCLLPALAARPPFLVPRLPAEPAASRQRRRRQLRQQDAPEALPYVSRTDGYRAQDFASTREGNVTAAARLREVSTSGSRDCSLRAPRLQNPNSPSSVPSTTCGEESPSLPSGTLLFLGGSRTRGHPRLVPSRGISADIRSDSPADRAARRSLRNLHTRVTWQPLPELQVNSPFYQSNWEAGREPDFAVVFKRAKAGAGRRPPSLLSICVASLNRMFPALIVSLFNYQQAMLNGRLLCSLLTWSRVCPPPQVILTFFMVASSCEPESFESLTSGHPLSPAEESRNRSEATAPGRPYADLQTKEGRIEGPVLTDGEAGGRQTNRTATGGEGDGGPGCLFDKTAYRMSAGSNFRQRYPFVDMLLHRVYLGEELFPSIPYLSAGVVEAIFCSRSLNRIDTQHHLISVILSWQFIQKAKGQLCRTFACFDPVIPHVIENATAHPLKSDGFLPCNDEQSLSSSPSCQRSVSSGVVLDVPQEECLVQSVEFCPAGCGPATHVLPAPTSPKRTAGESTVSLSPASLTLEKCTATSAGMVHARPRIHCRSIPATHPPQETTTASRESRIHSVTTCTKRCMRCRLCTVGSLCQQVLVNAAPWLRLASQNHMAAHSPWTALPHTSPQPSGAYWLQLHSLLRWHEREEAVEHRQLAGSRPSSDCNHRQDDYAVQLRAEADAEGGAGGGQAESRGEAEGGAAFEKFRQRRGWRLRRGPRYVAQSSGSTVGGSPCPYDPEEPLSAYFHPGEVLVWLHKRWRLVFIRRKRLPPKKTSRDSREPLPTSFDRPSSSRGDEVVDDLLTEHTVGGVSPLPDTGESAAQSRVPGIPRTPNRILAAPTAAPSPQIATRNTGGTFHNTERVVSKNVSLESVPGECLPEQSSPDHGSALARPEAVPFQGPASLAGHRTPTEVDGASREEAVERNQGEGAPYAASLNLDELSHISLTDLPDPSHLDFAACRSDVGRKKKPLRRRFVNKIMYASDRRWLEVLTNGPQYSRPEQQVRCCLRRIPELFLWEHVAWSLTTWCSSLRPFTRWCSAAGSSCGAWVNSRLSAGIGQG